MSERVYHLFTDLTDYATTAPEEKLCGWRRVYAGLGGLSLPFVYRFDRHWRGLEYFFWVRLGSDEFGGRTGSGKTRRHGDAGTRRGWRLRVAPYRRSAAPTVFVHLVHTFIRSLFLAVGGPVGGLRQSDR